MISGNGPCCEAGLDEAGLDEAIIAHVAILLLDLVERLECNGHGEGNLDVHDWILVIEKAALLVLKLDRLLAVEGRGEGFQRLPPQLLGILVFGMVPIAQKSVQVFLSKGPAFHAWQAPAWSPLLQR